MSQTPGSPLETLTACPACRHTSFRARRLPRLRIGETFFQARRAVCALVRCRACGLEFVNPRPVQSVLEEFYNQPGYAAHPETDDAARLAVAHSRAARLPGLVLGARVLDIGCGNGLLLEVLRKSGCVCVGMEPSVHGRRVAAARGFPVYADIAALAASERAFDRVTLFHVLEHVADPDALLATVRGLLVPSGLLCIEVPNLGSARARAFGLLPAYRAGDDDRYRAFPIHLYGFRAQSLSVLLQRNGFGDIRVSTAGFGFDRAKPLADMATTGVTPSSSSPETRSTWGGLARALWRRVEQLGLGENLMAVASPSRESPLHG